MKNAKPTSARLILICLIGAPATVCLFGFAMFDAPESLVPIYLFGIIASLTIWIGAGFYACVRLVTYAGRKIRGGRS